MSIEIVLRHIKEGLKKQGKIYIHVSYAVPFGLTYREAHKVVSGELIEWVAKLNKRGIKNISVQFADPTTPEWIIIQKLNREDESK